MIFFIITLFFCTELLSSDNVARALSLSRVIQKRDNRLFVGRRDEIGRALALGKEVRSNEAQGINSAGMFFGNRRGFAPLDDLAQRRLRDQRAAGLALDASLLDSLFSLPEQQQMPLPAKAKAQAKLPKNQPKHLPAKAKQGNATALPNRVRIEAVPVVRQAGFEWSNRGPIGRTGLTWEDIAASEGGNCGYHAFRNVLNLVQDRGINRNRMLQQTAQNLLDNQDYQDMMGLWGPRISRHRHGSADISWLGGGELELLVREFAGNLPMIVIEHVQHGDVEFTEQQLTTIQNFIRADHAKLGFVWNSGVRTDVSRMGGFHWVGFVAVKNGQNIVLYYLNSSPGIDPNFDIIIRLFSNTPQQIQAMIDRRLVEHMRNDIERLERKLQIYQHRDDNAVYTRYRGCENNQGIWENINTRQLVRYASGLDCRSMQRRYPGSWFVRISDRDQFVFYPNDMLNDILSVCLRSWREYQRWPVEIQQGIARLLLDYLRIADVEQYRIAEGEFGSAYRAIETILEKLPSIDERLRNDIMIGIDEF